MNPDDIQIRIAELDRQINSEVAGIRMPGIGNRRQFPTMTCVMAVAAFGWYRYGDVLPSAEELHVQYATYGFYAAVVLGALALWSAFLYLIQPSPKISPEYRASTERVRAMQEERRELVARLRSLRD